ncbi:MAG: hypothetical protein WC071_03815 [Victivallaceae bacterium]
MNSKLKKLFGAKPIVWVPMWGISKLRKRGGEFAGEIPGNALWFDQWYDRAMSRETAEKLAGLGVNLVILPFSLGGSLEAEAAERKDFERMTGWLHEFGIVSLPYLQYQNVLQEENIPESTVWRKRSTEHDVNTVTGDEPPVSHLTALNNISSPLSLMQLAEERMVFGLITIILIHADANCVVPRLPNI